MADERKQDSESDQSTHVPGTRRGEQIKKEDGQEPGRHDEDNTGKDRPAGGSTLRDSTGVNPKDPVDKKSPKLIPQ